MTTRRALCRLASNPYDQEALTVVIDTYSWIVEEEVSFRFGSPSWFPPAEVLVFLEIVCGAANYAPETSQPPRWIRAAARGATLRLERKLWNDPTGLDLTRSKSSCRNLESLVTHLLNTRMSLFWADFRWGTPTHDPVRRSSRSLEEVWDVCG